MRQQWRTIGRGAKEGQLSKTSRRAAPRITLDEAARIAGRHRIRPHVWLRNNGYLFEGVPLEGSSLIDIGSGAGWASAYAAVAGARRVVSVEPQADGSGSDMLETAAAVRRELGLEDVVEIVPKTIEQAGISEKFDIVLVNNAVNHIHEEACAVVHRDVEAQAVYAPFFQQLADSCVEGGRSSSPIAAIAIFSAISASRTRSCEPSTGAFTSLRRCGQGFSNLTVSSIPGFPGRPLPGLAGWADCWGATAWPPILSTVISD